MIAASAWPDCYIHPHCRPCRHDRQSHIHINRLHIAIIFTLYCNTEPAPSPPDQSLRKSLSLRVWWKINIWNITSEVRGGRSKMKISDPRSAKNLKIRSWPRKIFFHSSSLSWFSPPWPPALPRLVLVENPLSNPGHVGDLAAAWEGPIQFCCLEIRGF